MSEERNKCDDNLNKHGNLTFHARCGLTKGHKGEHKYFGFHYEITWPSAPEPSEFEKAWKRYVFQDIRDSCEGSNTKAFRAVFDAGRKVGYNVCREKFRDTLIQQTVQIAGFLYVTPATIHKVADALDAKEASDE